MENLTKMDDLGYTPILGTSVLVHTGPYLTFFTRESVKLCSAHRWLMTTAELTSYDAASYPPPCVDPSFFEGRYGPRHGWAMIPQSLYKTEKENSDCTKWTGVTLWLT